MHYALFFLKNSTEYFIEIYVKLFAAKEYNIITVAISMKSAESVSNQRLKC
jgi:hypothetical protein